MRNAITDFFVGPSPKSLSIVDNAQVHKRHSIFPIDYTIEPRPLSKTNGEYIEHAVKLGREAAEKCLERAGLRPDEIDLIITVSCTGFMIPSLDAHLINLMGFRSNVRRMPFTELGCAAGAMALGRAADFLAAHPGGNVLIIAVELPTLTFQRKDISQANLISSILFPLHFERVDHWERIASRGDRPSHPICPLGPCGPRNLSDFRL